MKPAFLTFAAVLGALAMTAPARAEMTGIRTAQLSFELYAHGVETGDALLVLAAARIRQGLDLKESEVKLAGAAKLPGKSATVGLSGGARMSAPVAGGAAAEAEEGSDGTPVSAAQMLDTARELAAGDEALLGLIDDAATEAGRGVSTGQVYSISQIRDGGTDTYDPLPFTGGEYAEVYVESRDGSDLNLYIYDGQGRLVCSDTDISAISYCGWRPSQSGSFVIEVKNRGRGGAGYSLMTN